MFIPPAGRLQDRREFVRRGALAVAGVCLLPGVVRAAAVAKRPLFTSIGVCSPLTRAAEFKADGAEFLVEDTARFLMPDRPEADFAASRAAAAAAPLPVRACNVFLPRTLRCTGPDADPARVLAYAETVFRRLKSIGGEYMVLGSGGARQLPPGWSKAQGDEQFVALLRAMGPLAAHHGLMVAVEAQRTAECNYLNHLSEVVAVVAAANQPSIRVLADLYHMAWMGDSPVDIVRAAPWLGLVEIAEKEKRTPPGVAGDDFRPYFAALARGGYSGRVDIEATGTPEQWRGAFAELRRQVADATTVA